MRRKRSALPRQRLRQRQERPGRTEPLRYERERGMRNSPAVRNCERDEGRPFGVGVQA
jgi:hypothetical protein